MTDEETHVQFRFCLPGDRVNEHKGPMLLDQISNEMPRNGIVVLSGGAANGLADDFPQELQRVVARGNGRIVVDTSKQPLLRLIDFPIAPLDVLRLNRSELEKAIDQPIRSIADNLAFTNQLVQRGVARIVVTGHGAEGSVIVAGHEKFFCHAPKVRVRSKIGAGDALIGSFTLSLSQGDQLAQSLKWGVAVAAATVGTDGTALCNLAETEAFLSQCRLERF